jgi:hypothetical protein
VRQLESLAKSQPGSAKVFELLAQGYSGLGNREEAQRAETRARTLRERPVP